ncbi:MAG: hypothetical protein LBJ12_01640 [Oscillospiraceae bacterium]|nr:hypothetical protein [Oscillospiraceae bacterium]
MESIIIRVYLAQFGIIRFSFTVHLLEQRPQILFFFGGLKAADKIKHPKQ